jgi:hypothetical protein
MGVARLPQGEISNTVASFKGRVKKDRKSRFSYHPDILIFEAEGSLVQA